MNNLERWQAEELDQLIDFLASLNQLKRCSSLEEKVAKQIELIKRISFASQQPDSESFIQRFNRESSHSFLVENCLSIEDINDLSFDSSEIIDCQVQLSIVFETLFDFPSSRLAAYGTLRPGESNYHQVEIIKGVWTPGAVSGILFEKDGYPVLNFTKMADEIEVQVLESKQLPDHWGRLDDFEGSNYERILVPVKTFGRGYLVCNLYNSV